MRHRNQLQQKQNPRQHHQTKASHQCMDEWKSAERSGPVQILGIHTNQGWNIIKGSNDQTGTGTLSNNKAIGTMEKKPFS